MKLIEYLPQIKQSGEVGLELEIEARRPLPERVPKPWFVHMEGSLRGHAYEYVTRGPIPDDENKFHTIKTLTDILEPCDVIKDSPRTSTHVHVNVQQFTLTQIYSIMCFYWLVENLLVKYCGETIREGNHFCLRLKDAEDIIRLVCRDVQVKTHFQSFIHNPGHRYSALNIASVPKFGSLEFRSMRGSIDPQLVHSWSSELNRMCHRASKYNPDELLDLYYKYQDENKVGFLLKFLSVDLVQELMKFKKWDDLLDENVGMVCDLAYLQDWSKYKPEPMYSTGKKKKPPEWNNADAFVDIPEPDPAFIRAEFDRMRNRRERAQVEPLRLFHPAHGWMNVNPAGEVINPDPQAEALADLQLQMQDNDVEEDF